MVGQFSRKCVPCRVGVGTATLLVALGLSGLAAGTLEARQRGAREQDAAQERSATVPVLEVVPSVMHFVDVPVGEKYTQAVRFTNPGKAAVRVEKISIDAPDFGISGLALPLVLGPESSADFTISYRPRAAGRSAVEMNIETSGDTAPMTAEIMAAAIGGQTELVASEAAVHFEDVPIGGKDVKEVSVTNTGNRDVRIAQISVSGNDFNVSGGAVNLAPGQVMSLEVRFAPRDAGEKSGRLSIVCEGGNSAVQIPLSGGGAQASQSAIRLQWEGNPAGAQGYQVYRSSQPGGPYERVSSGAVESPAYTDSGLSAGHSYYYVVTSIDANSQESEFSEQITATVP
jgi:hypothetical protein